MIGKALMSPRISEMLIWQAKGFDTRSREEFIFHYAVTFSFLFSQNPQHTQWVPSSASKRKSSGVSHKYQFDLSLGDKEEYQNFFRLGLKTFVWSVERNSHICFTFFLRCLFVEKHSRCRAWENYYRKLCARLKLILSLCFQLRPYFQFRWKLTHSFQFIIPQGIVNTTTKERDRSSRNVQRNEFHLFECFLCLLAFFCSLQMIKWKLPTRKEGKIDCRQAFAAK